MNPLPVHPGPEKEDRPHAERSASQLPNLAVCPGYRPDKKPRPVHWRTEQGIRGHSAMEQASNEDLQSDYEIAVVELIREFEKSLKPAVSEEREVRIETIEGRWGYADLVRTLDPDPYGTAENGNFQRPEPYEVDLVDYKFVRRKEVMDAEHNLQGKDYVVGIFLSRPAIDRVNVFFPMPGFKTVTHHTFTRSDLPRLQLEIFSVLTLARKTDKKRPSSKLFRPTYEVCRYCGFKAQCPALNKIAKAVAEKYATDPLPPVPEYIHPSEVNDPKLLGAMKTLAPILEDWSASVTHHAFTKAIDSGIMPEGYKIGYLRGRRKVTNPFALVTIAQKYGVKVDDLLQFSNISIAKIEDLVVERTPKGTKKKDQKAAFLDELRAADAIDRIGDAPYLERITQGNS